MTKDELLDLYPDDMFLFADGFDDCIIGVDIATHRVVYHIEKCLQSLVDNQNMTHSEALEYFNFNTVGAYVGELTPIWCETNE